MDTNSTSSAHFAIASHLTYVILFCMTSSFISLKPLSGTHSMQPAVQSKPSKSLKRPNIMGEGNTATKRSRVAIKDGFDADDVRSKDGKKPDQIGFYTGETRTILEHGKSLIRILLSTFDLFPTAEDSKDAAVTIFDESCIEVLGCRANCTPR